MNEILLHNIIEMLQQVADCLYQENLKPAYIVFAAILPKIEELICPLDENVKEDIENRLSLVLDAMEQEDSVLFADAIQYELLDYLKELEG